MLVVLVHRCLAHLHAGAILFPRKFQGITWHRSETGEINKQIVALAEKISSCMSALGGSDKYANVAPGIERDIGGEASAAAGFLNDHGWIIRLVEVHPPEADAVGNTRVPEALRPAEIRGWDVRRSCGRIMVHGDAGQIEKVFEPTRHVVGCRIHTSRPGSGRRIGTPTLIPGPDEKASALAGSGAQRRIPQPKGFGDSVRKELRVGFAGSDGQGVREQVEPDVGIVRGGSGRKAQAIAREPLPAKAIVGKGEMAGIAQWIGDLAREASRVRGQIAQGDGAAALATHRADRNSDLAGGELLQGVGEGYASLGDQLHEQVRRHDLGHRAKTDEGISVGLLVGARIRLTIALHPRLLVADHHDDHSCGAAPAEEVRHEGVGGLELRERCGLGLHAVPG